MVAAVRLKLGSESMNIANVTEQIWDDLAGIAYRSWTEWKDQVSNKEIKSKIKEACGKIDNRFYLETYSNLTAGVEYTNTLDALDHTRIITLSELQLLADVTKADNVESARGWLKTNAARVPQQLVDAKLARGHEAMVGTLENSKENEAFQPPAEAQWKRDSITFDRCHKCRVTLAFSRHHCRRCGEIFCAKCSSHQQKIWNPLKPGGKDSGWKIVRVCDPCWQLTSQVQLLPGHVGWLDTQPGKGDRAQAIKGTRLFMRFSDADAVSRVQFSVTQGGGTVLYSRLTNALARFFAASPEGIHAINAFKVFGEQDLVGRPDSTVIYLNKPFRDPVVQRFWTDYVVNDELKKVSHYNKNVNPGFGVGDVDEYNVTSSTVRAGSDLKDSINTDAEVPGLFPMTKQNDGGWAINLPQRALVRNYCAIYKPEYNYGKEIFGGSAGGLVTEILEEGFRRAMWDFTKAERNKSWSRTQVRNTDFKRQAKKYVKEIIREFYGGPPDR
jgi:hypothetical protein